jgi:hypothetical protein
MFDSEPPKNKFLSNTVSACAYVQGSAHQSLISNNKSVETFIVSSLQSSQYETYSWTPSWVKGFSLAIANSGPVHDQSNASDMNLSWLAQSHMSTGAIFRRGENSH